MKISNLRISHWDGLLEQNHATDFDPARDTVWLGDGSALSGTLESKIITGKYPSETAKEKAEVPLARLREARFAQARNERRQTTRRWFCTSLPGPTPPRLTAGSCAASRKSCPMERRATRAQTFAQGGTLIFQLDGRSPEASGA